MWLQIKCLNRINPLSFPIYVRRKKKSTVIIIIISCVSISTVLIFVMKKHSGLIIFVICLIFKAKECRQVVVFLNFCKISHRKIKSTNFRTCEGNHPYNLSKNTMTMTSSNPTRVESSIVAAIDTP